MKKYAAGMLIALALIGGFFLKARTENSGAAQTYKIVPLGGKQSTEEIEKTFNQMDADGYSYNGCVSSYIVVFKKK